MDAASICCKKLTAIQELQEANVDGNSKIVSFVLVPSEDLNLSSGKISPFDPCGQGLSSGEGIVMDRDGLNDNGVLGKKKKEEWELEILELSLIRWMR